MNWIGRAELDRFAARLDAELKLPRLVAELILATSPTPDVIRFLSGDAGRVRGFDGILTSPGGPPFVPEGESVWEFGCSGELRDKIRRDLRDRTAGTSEAQRARTTLVLVTPRHYDTPGQPVQDWVENLAAGTGWKAVRVLDGASLVHWLDEAPSVAARWARSEFGVFPQGVRSTDEFWEDYATRFDPPLTEDVLLAGRQEQADEVVRRLSLLEPDRVAVSADSPDEALAFAVAAVRRADETVRIALETRSLVVDRKEAARDLRTRKFVFFPTGEAATAAGLLAQHGATVVALGRADEHGSTIRLLRPPRHVFADALARMPRVSDARARQLAAECGRSVTVLARCIPATGRSRPSWADTEAEQLIPALLAGAWDAARQGDRELLAKLAGVGSYEEWEARVQHLHALDDAPLEHAGSVWKVRAPADAFVLLGSRISRQHLARFRQACLDVLGAVDANLDHKAHNVFRPPPGSRHSDWLREGMATLLLLASTLHAPAGFGAVLAAEGGPERWVAELVSDLPGLSADTRLLASLRGTLPILAEAAPTPFVAAVERLLARDGGAAALPLFREETDFLVPWSHHTYVVWALEILAWSPSTLPRVAVVLARLAAIDPGGKLANRPIRSLRTILLPWLPSTDADLSLRLATLDAVVRTSDAVGWDLCLQLLPDTYSVSDGTARPRMREARALSRGVPLPEMDAAHHAAAKHVLHLVGDDPDRWSALIGQLSSLPEPEQGDAILLLDGFLAQASKEVRRRVWDVLRRTASRHASYRDAEWALSPDRVEALAALVRKWAPGDRVERAAALFDDVLPDELMVELEVADEPTEADLDKRRAEALGALLASEGRGGLLRLAASVKLPWMVAKSAAPLVASVADTMALCNEALASPALASGNFAPALSGYAEQRYGAAWREALAAASAGGMAPDAVVRVSLGLDDGPATWDFVASLGPKVDRTYWTLKRPWRLPDGDAGAVERAARRFLEAGRPAAAVTMLDQARNTVPPALAFEALDAMVAALNAGGGRDAEALMVPHRLERLFEALGERADVDPVELARRELTWLPVLVPAGRSARPLALFGLLAREPALFSSLVEAVFRPASAPVTSVDKAAEARAHAAFQALDAFHSVPGTSEAGLDGEVLKAWVRDALRLLAEADRAAVGAQYVGKLLAHAPPDPGDRAWPAVPVREVIEEVALGDLEAGIRMERFNMRGPFSRGLYEGGREERAFAADARAWAAACAAWPRTGALLESVAEMWKHYAERADIQARQRLMED